MAAPAEGARSTPVSIALAPYPRQVAQVDVEIEKRMATLQAVIGAARTIRSEHDVKPALEVPLRIRVDDDTTRAWLASCAGVIKFLVKTKDAPVFEKCGGAREAGTTVSVVPQESGAIHVLVGLKGLVTAEMELARIEREIKRIDKELAVLDKKLGAKGFVDRAPKEVIDEAQGQRRALVEARGRLDEERSLASELE